MKISADEVKNVSHSAGFGYTNHKGVRAWMEAKGFSSWADFASAYKCVKREAVQREIEDFAFGEAS
jgi:hypothetical protein